MDKDVNTKSSFVVFFLLATSFVMLFAACLGILLVGYRDYRLFLGRQELVVADAYTNVFANVAGITKKAASTKVAIAQLQAEQKNALDSNTIAFLFSMLGIAVFSVVGYLLTETRDKLAQAEVAAKSASASEAKAKQIVERMGPFVRDVGEAFVTSSLVMEARYATSRLCEAEVSQLGYLRPGVLDSYTFLKNKLELISRDVGFEQTVYDSYMDQVVSWKSELSSYSKRLSAAGDKTIVQDLIVDCDRIIDLLERGKFTDTYRRNLTALKAEELKKT